MDQLIQAICEQNQITLVSFQSVHGGDINEAFELNVGDKRLFLKANTAETFPGMFVLEADGLKALKSAASLRVPEVYAVGEMDGKQYILMEWLEKGRLQKHSWRLLGTGLAQLHQQTADSAGWHSDNYIGSLTQSNTRQPAWAEFYGQQRILPLVKKLYDRGDFAKPDQTAAAGFCNHLEKIFPEEPFRLLHGDLWSGNFTITGNGVPAIFDPAVYFGHREMDIGMTKLFGGFDAEFYDRYNEVLPLEKGWKKRLPVTQLYPLLVHAVLFGGGYIQQSRMIIQDWR